MDLCSDGHEEICYERRYCPVCDLKKELTDEIDTLKSEISELKDQIENLQEEA